MSEPKKVLIVEDEANLRELVKARLEQHGYLVETVADGYNAIFQTRRFKPDLIILDLMIPKMDGYTVCRMLKSSADLASIPVIMFTARTSSEDMRRGMDMGADAYITKPFNPEALLQKINELLSPKTEKPVEVSTPAESPTTPPAAEKEHEVERKLVEQRSREEAQTRTQDEHKNS